MDIILNSFSGTYSQRISSRSVCCTAAHFVPSYLEVVCSNPAGPLLFLSSYECVLQQICLGGETFYSKIPKSLQNQNNTEQPFTVVKYLRWPCAASFFLSRMKKEVKVGLKKLQMKAPDWFWFAVSVM